MLTNCLRCGSLFVQSGARNICPSCYQEEEGQYERVVTFLRKRENRTATMYEVVKKTNVPDLRIQQFIQQGRLLIAKFPNLGYPCLECGQSIREGKLCHNCAQQLKNDLAKHEIETKRQNERQDRLSTYRLKDK
ncbi:TIGR03826 family flagellar region protein [Priestia flexa]|uniref:TIGR03826 family flagellar region protein n=1 Tax=Priestia flexa TaxID=86664 RepID=UPI000E6A164F|nr:TIGR03826 family flagellar region protein [Priestia flexa]RIV15051.1 hypothetical protein D1859_01930 [Priestia flexa]